MHIYKMSVANVSFKDTEGVSYSNVSSCISHNSKIALKRRKRYFSFLLGKEKAHLCYVCNIRSKFKADCVKTVEGVDITTCLEEDGRMD